MSLININGVDLPYPTGYSVGIQNIQKADRNANGTMIMELIAVKRTISLSWSFLTSTDLSQILSSVSGSFFTVTYTDPQTGGTNTGTFYCGDRNCGMLDFISGVPRYKDVKFDLIER